MAEYVTSFGHGVTVSPATKAEFDEANACMRAEDLAEVRVFGDEAEPFEEWEKAFAVRIGGDLVGILGFVPLDCIGRAGDSRVITFLTTDKVLRHRFSFARMSRTVAEWLFQHEVPSHVRTLYACTTASYGRSLEWERRLLGFREDGRGKLNGVEHVFLSRPKELGGA